MDGSNLSKGVWIYLDVWWLHHNQLLLDQYGCKYEHGIYMILLILLVTSNTLNKLIIDFDQTLAKYVPTENVTIAEKNSKHVARKGDNGKGE